MTEQEKLSMYKSACAICLLAEKMKTCKLCKFIQPEKINTVSIHQIPAMVEIAGMKVNLQDRLENFMRGKTIPAKDKFYLHDVLSWMEYEGITNLRQYCTF